MQFTKKIKIQISSFVVNFPLLRKKLNPRIPRPILSRNPGIWSSCKIDRWSTGYKIFLYLNLCWILDMPPKNINEVRIHRNMQAFNLGRNITLPEGLERRGEKGRGEHRHFKFAIFGDFSENILTNTDQGEGERGRRDGTVTSLPQISRRADVIYHGFLRNGSWAILTKQFIL